MIYFIWAEGTQWVKIGFTSKKKVLERMRTLQTGCPLTLKVLLLYPGGQWVEEALHKKFASAKHQGEWFTITDELAAYILKKLSRYPNVEGLVWASLRKNPELESKRGTWEWKALRTAALMQSLHNPLGHDPLK